MSRPLRSATSAIVLFILACLVGLSVDLLTKWLAFDNESTKLVDSVVLNQARGRWEATGTDERAVHVLPKLLEFHATVNEGAVFGLGQGKQLIFVAVSVLAIGFLVTLVSKTRSRFEAVLLGCLLAGVLGNMYDRIRFGYVRDMILGLPGVHWQGTWTIPGLGYPGSDRLVFPYIFNVADVLLVCGVAILLVRSFFMAEKPVEKKTTDATSSDVAQPTST
jgi:lipoprotein signal peptidase